MRGKLCSQSWGRIWFVCECSLVSLATTQTLPSTIMLCRPNCVSASKNNREGQFASKTSWALQEQDTLQTMKLLRRQCEQKSTLRGQLGMVPNKPSVTRRLVSIIKGKKSMYIQRPNMRRLIRNIMITAEVHSFTKEYLWSSQNTLDTLEVALLLLLLFDNVGSDGILFCFSP